MISAANRGGFDHGAPVMTDTPETLYWSAYHARTIAVETRRSALALNQAGYMTDADYMETYEAEKRASKIFDAAFLAYSDWAEAQEKAKADAPPPIDPNAPSQLELFPK